jgi:hypothetical protein
MVIPTFSLIMSACGLAHNGDFLGEDPASKKRSWGTWPQTPVLGAD